MFEIRLLFIDDNEDYRILTALELLHMIANSSRRLRTGCRGSSGIGNERKAIGRVGRRLLCRRNTLPTGCLVVDDFTSVRSRADVRFGSLIGVLTSPCNYFAAFKITI